MRLKVKIQIIEQDYLTEQEAKEFKKLFAKCIKSYKTKAVGVSDKEWLKSLFKEELPDMTEDEVDARSTEIVEAMIILIQIYHQ